VIDQSDQTSLYETQLENPEVEELLEAREKVKAQASAVAKRARTADAAAKAALEQLDLGNGAPVRIGRFLVRRRHVAAADGRVRGGGSRPARDQDDRMTSDRPTRRPDRPRERGR
jgi:hypothetical protein